MTSNGRVEVGEESEQPGGWSYRVARLGAHHRVLSTHTVVLSWVDHDALSGGTSAPSSVIRAVLQALVDAGVEEWPERFDASTARRWVPDLAGMVAQKL